MSARDFIELALEHKVLKFGEYKLKSGRISPYFFNMGAFTDAKALRQVSVYYAKLLAPQIEKDAITHLFGPAYKGIPLASVTALSLLELGYNLKLSFNRKEVKDHGEGGILMGAPIEGNIALIDDVITAGTTVYEVKKYIEAQSGVLKIVAIALDRQEVDSKGVYTKEALLTNNIKVLSIIQMEDLIEYLNAVGNNEYVDKILAYKALYGV